LFDDFGSRNETEHMIVVGFYIKRTVPFFL